MTMIEKLSTTFERQVERIHQLLERAPSRVVWNNKIPDPDNPEQPRQIDISIDRDGEKVHVECRIHNSPQDVKWIEELIGRKVSLRIDVMIAVSSSGFTSGAMKKAAAFNIHLRTLKALTDDELRLWVDPAKAWLVFYEFVDCRLSIEMLCEAPPEEATITREDGGSIEWRTLFEPAMTRFDNTPELDHEARAFALEGVAAILVNGKKPNRMKLSARARRLRQTVSLTTILQYMDPQIEESGSARVQKHADEILEIVQSSDQVALIPNLKNIVVPPNSFLYSLDMDFIQPVKLNWVKLASSQIPQSAIGIEILIGYNPTE
ncbi:restriction endonuclease [Bradyrhizobium sp. CCGB12]|uniref:restriction endonuclease n=1 Tax=Bradyrhizobium sp. CCGB12 TaxID=2949632 RepID=UPI0020B3B40F|nr:restriction endonuclease [Bradyrhizobium sp. CCGB12]MCP3394726.1 restriction endonuclease [Bradyrhizobium sp. CCGB12]